MMGDLNAKVDPDNTLLGYLGNTPLRLHGQW